MKKLNTADEVLQALHELADPNYITFKQKKFNIVSNHSIGVSQKQLNQLVRSIEKSDELALQLYESGVYEARILCSKLYNPKHLTPALMEEWTHDFENWEICDSFCLAQYAKTNPQLTIEKIFQWTPAEQEFVRRAAFATIAGYTRADKTAENSVYEQFFPLITQASIDERIYVKKAVDWALRSIGKRNIDLNQKAQSVAKTLVNSENKTAQWIGKTSLKELQSKSVSIANYPRSIYATN